MRVIRKERLDKILRKTVTGFLSKKKKIQFEYTYFDNNVHVRFPSQPLDMFITYRFEIFPNIQNYAKFVYQYITHVFES